MTARTGIGMDVHPLVEGRLLVLAGVTIPHDRGLAGHSDGDVVTHAVVDALLGAAALGDIGSYFPSDDPQYENMESLSLLAKSALLLRESGWQAANLDVTIVAERPRLTSHVPQMRRSLAATLKMDVDAVSVKATTTDGLGAIGRGEGIAAHAVVAIETIS